MPTLPVEGTRDHELKVMVVQVTMRRLGHHAKEIERRLGLMTRSYASM